MSSTIIVEKLGNVSLRNGIVYVQCMAAGVDGEDKVVSELAIPINLYSQISAGLQSAGVQLTERLKELKDKEVKKTENKKETVETKPASEIN